MPPVSRNYRLATGAISVAVILSALAYLAASLTLSPRPSFVQLGLEPVVLVAGVFGLLFSTGRFQWAPAMTLVCVAGTILIASILVYRGMLGQVAIKGQSQGWSLKPWLAGRLVAAALLMAMAGAHVLSRSLDARRQFKRGLIATAPLAASLAAIVIVRNYSAGGTMPGWLTAALLGAFGIVASIALCAAGHYFIRAFEIGADAGEGRKPDRCSNCGYSLAGLPQGAKCPECSQQTAAA